MPSGYFSAPETTLDPNLFEGDMLRGEIHGFIIGTLITALENEGFRKPKNWVHVWIAGSSITYQWSADRGNGDIDVLFGVDIPAFALDNPGYEHYSEATLAGLMNAYLKKVNLWPHPNPVQFGQRKYEVTFFINPAVENDITHIHPYAAYDVMTDTWTVRPPELPADPGSMYPKQWFDWADLDRQASDALRRRYDASTADLEASPAGSPGYHNAGAQRHLTAAQAQALFGDIHVGRTEAFEGAGGKGYGDWNNFRWQQAKATGVLDNLHEMMTGQDEEQEQRDTELYGGPLAGADELIRRATERYR